LEGPAESSPFLLRVLGFHKKSDSEIDLLVTSYQVGSIQIPNFAFRQAATTFKSNQTLQWDTVSLVQEQEKKGVKVEPYGPFGPLQLSFSLIIIIYLVTWGVFLVGSLVYLTWLGQRRKKLLRQTPFLSSLKPIVEFQKAIRLFQRTQQETLNQDLLKLDQAWRVYWTRRFAFPALFWSEGRLAADFKKKHWHVYQSNSKRFDNFLGEMRKLRKKEIEPQLEEFQKLVRETRVFIEWIESQGISL